MHLFSRVATVNSSRESSPQGEASECDGKADTGAAEYKSISCSTGRNHAYASTRHAFAKNKVARASA